MRSLLLLCVFLLAFRQGMTLKCYLCGSAGGINAGQPSCGDPFNKSQAKICDAEGFVCMTTKVQGLSTARSCVPKGTTCNPINSALPPQLKIDCKICDTDLCNGADSNSAAPRSTATWTVLSFGAAAFVFRHFY
ncbi:Hypothetical predicted protein [Cloeon dipterum]|uniref:Protein quiver n=1 Tax=Cloeon dipterum TaxID=197152 RepID=A0A8S1DHR8_9INSE|nr:Hypothetical predicted protein [Cloeon dipterum]